MLLTVTTTGTAETPATDLGYLLHKHPDRAQSFSAAAGTAHVFYPKAEPAETTAALLLEVDPVALVRGRGTRGQDAFTLGQYVNDRPYAAGSLLAVALGTVFRTAMRGRCAARPELAATPLPLRVHLPALACRGGTDLVGRLFDPLGWRVAATPVPLDPEFADWGESRYADVTMDGKLPLSEALNHLYVLLPVLDDAKHYWVTEDEVDKLLRAGASWLPAHPDRELITDRYLRHRGAYVRSALERLADADDVAADELDTLDTNDAGGTDATTGTAGSAPSAPGPRAEPLAVRRRASVLAALVDSGARRVVDLGCGGGALLRELLAEPSFTEIVGVDVSPRALELAERALRLDRAGERVTGRVSLRQSALTYSDPDLAGYDAAVLMEVIEHVDQSRLPALEHSVFGVARPATVVVTTPNAEYNVRFDSLPAGAFRHPDHRFEWTRAQFHQWCDRVCAAHGYRVRQCPVGDTDPDVGPPTQLAVFSRSDA